MWSSICLLMEPILYDKDDDQSKLRRELILSGFEVSRLANGMFYKSVFLFKKLSYYTLYVDVESGTYGVLKGKHKEAAYDGSETNHPQQFKDSLLKSIIKKSKLTMLK